MIIFTFLGTYYALFLSPPDYQQGEMVRVMYVHVPSAWISLAIYSAITILSITFLIWQIPLTYLFSIAIAPIGAIFTLITLVTGALWGKPIWGTWWVWDARLTSMLILFFLYISYIIIYNVGDNIWRASKPASVIAIIGFANIPIIKFSVDIWYSLHQSSSISKFSSPSIHFSMITPLVIMFISFIMYVLIVMILRTRSLINTSFLK